MALRRLLASLQLPLLGLTLLLLAVGAWWPTLQSLTQPTADQVWEAFGLATACLADPSTLGWMGPVADAPPSASLFAPGLFGPLLPGLACRLAQATPLHPLQAYLLIGLVFTALLAALSCRWAGFRWDMSLLAAFLITTAPCSFSRVGHLSLAVLIPVLPTLVACLQLRRSLWTSVLRPLPLAGAGVLSALLTFPSQDYYVVFSLVLLFSCFALLLLLATSSSLAVHTLAAPLLRGGCYLAGFLALVLIVFLPKLHAAGMISLFFPQVPEAPQGVPPSWSAPRSVLEQFRYGLLPFTWVVPPPWLAATLEALRAGRVDISTENFAWSSGSLLIPVSWLVAIRQLAKPPAAQVTQRHDHERLEDGDRRFLALLLLLTTFIGLMAMTAGGVGTLFAALVSPVLRSLNRFTAFVYGASILYLVAELNLWLNRRGQSA